MTAPDTTTAVMLHMAKGVQELLRADQQGLQNLEERDRNIKKRCIIVEERSRRNMYIIPQELRTGRAPTATNIFVRLGVSTS